MSWTAPRTWVAGEVPTAAIMNAHIRDNPQALIWSEADVQTSQTTTSTSYTDLATSGPAVTLTTLTAAYVMVACWMSNSASNRNAMSYAVSGATTLAASDTWMMSTFNYNIGAFQSMRISRQVALTAGSNTFTAKYRTTAGTSTFQRRRIAVLGVGG